MASIRDRILANPSLAEMVLNKDLDGLAGALNAQGIKTIQPRFITKRAVITQCLNGKSILRKMKLAASQDEAIETALEFLSQETGLDIGDPQAQTNVDDMVTAGVLTPDEGLQVKNLALQPLIVSRLDVEAAMFNLNGTLK